EIINSYTEAIAAAELEPVVVDVDYFALENMFELNYDPPAGQPVALVNVGARYSSINILKEGRSTFTGDVPVGGAEYNDALARPPRGAAGRWRRLRSCSREASFSSSSRRAGSEPGWRAPDISSPRCAPRSPPSRGRTPRSPVSTSRSTSCGRSCA